MATLESLRRTIDSAEDLQSVVRTMKTLAAVAIRQYEEAVLSLADYSRTIHTGLRMALWATHEHRASQPPVGAADSGGNVGAIVFGSDQGMCGPFNEQIAAFAVERLREAAPGQPEFTALAAGARLLGPLEESGVVIDAAFSLPGSVVGLTPLVQEMLPRIDEWRTVRRLDQILLFHHERTSASSSHPRQRRLVPVELERWTHGRRWPSRRLPTFTIDRNRLISALLRQYLFVSLFRACAESSASENASRIASMQAAEKNIDDRLRELVNAFRQLRQTAITEELLDVIAGFEALSQRKR